MRKRDDIKLDVISGIDEEIIDQATDTRITLAQRVKRAAIIARRKWMAFGGIAASLLLICTVMLTVLLPMIGTESNIPVYQGMTVRRFSPAVSAASDGVGFLLSTDPLSVPGSGTDMAEDIKDIVDIDMIPDDEVKYYVDSGETFIIEVHISNPKNYEVQSFTLNGKKYANYMFKEGSTMELLLLEVTAPETPGYVEYTIDAIKYIDGTEIKDVDMSEGDKSIKVGIIYPTAPSAEIISKTITTTALQLSIHVSDPCGVIGANELSVYLSDGERIIDKKPLQIGDNTVSFSGLMMSKSYEYGILAVYDLVDGREIHQEWLETEKITTLGVFTFDHILTEKDAISFEIDRIGETGSITSVSLYDSATDTRIQTAAPGTRRFEGLLSDHTYDLYVDFTYTVKGETVRDQIIAAGITTEAKTAPEISSVNTIAEQTSVSYSLKTTDPDRILNVTKVALFKDGECVLENGKALEGSFQDLLSNTKYTVKVTYTYDLNDGSGVQTETATHAVKTKPHLSLHGASVINTSAVDMGETIYLQIDLDNPNHMVPQTVVINGLEYPISKALSTETVLVCEILHNGQFEGGETVFTVEQITMKLDGVLYTAKISGNNTTSVFINGFFDVESLCLGVYEDGVFTARDYVFPEETVYVQITLQNKTGYQLNAVTWSLYPDRYSVYTDLIKIDDEHYLFSIPITVGYRKSNLKSLTYSSGGVQETLEKYMEIRTVCLESRTVYPVSTPEDLLNMNSGYKYYELQNDIDLSGMEWRGKDFCGLLEGNGHVIRNMSFVGTLPEQEPYLGLFARSTGVIRNLHIENAKLISNSGSIGAITGGGIEYLAIDNCSVDKTSLISASDSSSDVGGLYGATIYAGGTPMLNIRNCVNNATVKSGGSAGGIVGSILSTGSGSIINCVNYGDVEGRSSCGGIIGDNQSLTISICENYGNVSGESSTGGIVGYSYGGALSNCVNHGTISAGGGIAGYNTAPISNCINNGSGYGGAYIGAITGHAFADLTNCVNNEKADMAAYRNGIFIDKDADVEISNCYSLKNATADQLSDKSFYTDVLHFDESIWDLDDLDIENGKYPKLKH